MFSRNGDNNIPLHAKMGQHNPCCIHRCASRGHVDAPFGFFFFNAIFGHGMPPRRTADASHPPIPAKWLGPHSYLLLYCLPSFLSPDILLPEWMLASFWWVVGQMPHHSPSQVPWSSAMLVRGARRCWWDSGATSAPRWPAVACIFYRDICRGLLP